MSHRTEPTASETHNWIERLCRNLPSTLPTPSQPNLTRLLMAESGTQFPFLFLWTPLHWSMWACTKRRLNSAWHRRSRWDKIIYFGCSHFFFPPFLPSSSLHYISCKWKFFHSPGSVVKCNEGKPEWLIKVSVKLDNISIHLLKLYHLQM